MVAPGVAGDLAEGAHVVALEAVHELAGKQVSKGDLNALSNLCVMCNTPM